MSEPIRGQIDTLREDLDAHHGAIMTKLDDILAAFEPPIDYSAGFASLGGKLDTIITKLGDTQAFLSASALFAVDWPAVMLSVQQLISGVIDGTVSLGDNVSLIQQTLGLHNGGAEFTLASLSRAQAQSLLNLNDLLDGLAKPWPANVLAALQCICTSTTAQLPPNPLDTTNPLACATPYTSTGFNLFPTVVPGYNTALIYATWTEPLPPGITFGTSVLGALDDGILSCADWSQYSVFVESDEDQYADDPISPNRYPTGEWRHLDGSGVKVFSVSERGRIKVYLCPYTPPDLIPPGECIDVPIDGLDGEGYRQIPIPTIYPDTYTLTVIKDGFYTRVGEGGSFNGPHSGNVPYAQSWYLERGSYIYTNSRDIFQLHICNPGT